MTTHAHRSSSTIDAATLDAALREQPSCSRIACIAVPLFPLAARLRSEPELTEEAVAVLAGSGPSARVVAATRSARRAGIRAGLTLAQARARLPKLIARARDAACEDAAREALLDVCESFSPRLEDAGEGMVYLDAVGLERLHADEDAFGRAVQESARKEAGLPVRIGVAGSKLAARIAAGQSGAPTVVPPGTERNFLAPLPLEQLSVTGKVLSTLERWGIRSVGDFASLPRDEVSSRLGEAGQRLQAIACGVDPEPLIPREPPPEFREGLELEWPLVQLEPFLFIARAALERLVARMDGRGLACRRLVISLRLEPDGTHERSLTLPAATLDVKTLLTLMRLDLEANRPGAPMTAFELIAHPDRPRAAQLTLFGPPALSPDQLATTLARLFSMLGEDRVGAPQVLDTHRPEGFALVPFAPPPPPSVREEPPRGRGLLTVRAVRPPLPVEVLVESAGDALRPSALRTMVGEQTAERLRVEGQVRVASGPWGMEEGWWEKDPVAREYWDVELDRGGLYRVYLEKGSGEWFVDGVYD